MILTLRCTHVLRHGSRVEGEPAAPLLCGHEWEHDPAAPDPAVKPCGHEFRRDFTRRILHTEVVR